MSGIEWGVFPNQSVMSVTCLDNTAAPSTVLDASEPFNVRVGWQVPAPINALIGGSFRLRVFAESIGPGQEQQIGSTINVAAVPNQLDYLQDIAIPGDTLQGEDVVPSSSGVYKIVAVLQHLNGGANEVSGFAESPLVQLRTP